MVKWEIDRGEQESKVGEQEEADSFRNGWDAILGSANRNGGQ